MRSFRFAFFVIVALFAFAGLPALCVAVEPVSKPISESPAIKVLIVDGFSNHDWKQTTQIVRGLLLEAGGFDIDVSTSPAKKKSEGWKAWRPRFIDYDVVIQNCNSIGGGPRWPREVETSLETYVRNGEGLYILHSANNAFPNWKEYNRMIGLGWRGKETGTALTVEDDQSITRIPPGEGRGTSHGPRVDTVVELLGSHPITKGYPKKWKTPLLEVYIYARGPAENLTVLSYAYHPKTQKNWPLEWVVRYGKGSVYNSTFGHVWQGDDQPISMRCVGFQTTLVRTTEWLATGKVTRPLPENFPTETEKVVREKVPAEKQSASP